jgi:uncharacterized protein YjbI with pentapeptide repeats
MQEHLLQIALKEGRGLVRSRHFSDVTLTATTLASARFDNCCFTSVRFHGGDFTDVVFSNCYLENVLIHHATLNEVRLVGSSCSGLVMVRCQARYVQISRSSLRCFDLTGTYLEQSTFAGSDIDELGFLTSTLDAVDFDHCRISNPNVRETTFLQSRLGGFCEAVGRQVYHRCTVDWSSICLSRDSVLLERFLIKTGMPDVFATYALACAQSIDPQLLIRLMRSTFISYGAPDVVFARRLHAELRRNGVMTFFFEHDAIPGKKLHDVMREEVNRYDRVVLVCSKDSLDRPGVRNEIEQALAREARAGGESFLIPIALDDYIFQWQPNRPGMALEIRDRVVADFRGASDNTQQFEVAMKLLLRALAI